MPDTDILVSELNSASQINTTDLLLMTQPDGDAQTGYSSRKGTVLQVANKLLKDTEYTTDLPNFDNKSVFGALNEIRNGTYIYKENETPYAIRQTPITANRTLEKLIGVSCAFNQLVNTGDTSINTTSGHKYVTKINNVWSIISGGSAVTIVDDSSDMVIDLTACFGSSEVADYFYNLEQNTAGSGIALFRQLFPEDYYAYQTATLISSKPVRKKIYDSDDNVIAEYPIGGDELRGLLKVVDGNLVAYGDIKPSDGNGTEVFDIVDLGTLNWILGNRNTDNDAYIFYFNFTLLKNNGGVIAEGYIYNPNMTSWESLKKGEFGITDTFIIFADDYNSAYDFKAAMSGVYLIYEKATPTAKSYTPFTNPMLCGSTEEFTDSRSLKMFVGHDSLYYTSNFKYW